MDRLKVDRLGRRFGDAVAIDEVSFEVRDGEFLTLLGPSGCGKSTTLFSIAGLDQPTSGRIEIDGKIVFSAADNVFVPPERRNCGLVFQSYALWPHMTVRQNIEFPLRLRGATAAARRQEVDWALDIVEMRAYADRHPHELSGGQQQRVALARTLVYRPSLLLLDEPLSNLDAKLRIRARAWLKELQSKLGLTTVFVTHDQGEALSLSDRVAVMSEGRIEQIGTAEDVYRRPASAFIADFVGHSNLVEGWVSTRDDAYAEVAIGEQQVLRVPVGRQFAAGSRVVVSVRPEHLRLLSTDRHPAGQAGNLLRGRLVQRDYFGAHFHYVVEVAGNLLRVEASDRWDFEDVCVEVPADECIAFPRES